jgi:DNA-binding transcriptional MocR family regulator
MSHTAKYLQLAQIIIADIESDRLTVNEKLPSLRTISQLHRVSMTTALACYRYLEQHGYVIAEEKKGFYVQRPFQKRSSPDLNIFPQFTSAVIKALPDKYSTKDNSIENIRNYSLATAQLDESLIDKKLLSHSMQSVMKKSDFNFGYSDSQGETLFREQLAIHFSQQGFTTNTDDLIITNGCLDAVVLALEVVSNINDVIAVTSPCYSGLLDILSLLNRAVIEIPSTENGIDLVQLEQAINEHNISACLITANHQNPTGHSLCNEQKQKLAHLASKYQLPIIEDDVYRELSHQRTVPLPIKYYDQNGWVLWCSSFSKTLAPSLRLGWCNPGRFSVAYQHQRKTRTLGTNQPMQLAMADYLAKGHYARHLKKVNRELSKHCKLYIEYLEQQFSICFSNHLGEHIPEEFVKVLPSADQKGLNKPWQIYYPTGGLVLWVRIANINAEKLATSLAEQGVWIRSGDSFSTMELYLDCFRINLGLIPDVDIFEQLKTIAELASEFPFKK